MSRSSGASQTRKASLTLKIPWRNPSALAGLMIIAFMVLMAVSAGWLAPFDPIRIDLAARLTPPGPVHWLGTDEMGRDILSRIMFGARISLSIGLLVVGMAGGVGTVVGVVSGYFGGWIDSLIMRIMDVMLSFPSLVLALALAAALGPSLTTATFAVAVVMTPKFARLARGEALVIREMQFIAAARASGASNRRILWHHLLPNCMNSVIVLGTLTIGEAILIAASLSFIGMGAQPPTPEWGAMVSVGRKFVMDQWWYAASPGLFIAATVIGFNILGDALRDILDPRIRR